MREPLAARTACPFAPVFGHFGSRLGDINPLPTLDRVGFHLAHLCPTMLAVRDGSPFHHRIGRVRPLQGLAGRSWLAPDLCVAVLASAFRFLLADKTIRRRREQALLTVFRQSVLQLVDLLLQPFTGFQKHWYLFDVFAKQGMFFSQQASFVFSRQDLDALPCGSDWQASRRPD
jgi:hypothetical protein